MASKKTSNKKDAGTQPGKKDADRGGAGMKKDGEPSRTTSFKGTDLQLASPSMHDVRAHHDGFKPSGIGAKAYATGDKVSFKGGAEPSQGLIGHEAAHIVQQRAGAVKKDA